MNYYCVSANTLLWTQSTHGQRTISKLFWGYGTSISLVHIWLYNEAVHIICLWSVVYVTGWEVCMAIRCGNVSADRSSSTTSSLQHLSDGFSNLTIDVLWHTEWTTHIGHCKKAFVVVNVIIIATVDIAVLIVNGPRNCPLTLYGLKFHARSIFYSQSGTPLPEQLHWILVNVWMRLQSQMYMG